MTRTRARTKAVLLVGIAEARRIDAFDADGLQDVAFEPALEATQRARVAARARRHRVLGAAAGRRHRGRAAAQPRPGTGGSHVHVFSPDGRLVSASAFQSRKF